MIKSRFSQALSTVSCGESRWRPASDMLFDLPQQVKPSPDGGRLLHRHTPPPRSRLAAYFLEAPPKTLNVTEAGRQHLAEERSILEKMVAGLLQCAEVAGITRVFAIAQL